MGITKAAASSCASPPAQTGCPGTLTAMPLGKSGRVCFCSVGVRAALRVGVTTFMRLQQGSKDPALPAAQPVLEPPPRLFPCFRSQTVPEPPERALLPT